MSCSSEFHVQGRSVRTTARAGGEQWHHQSGETLGQAAHGWPGRNWEMPLAMAAMAASRPQETHFMGRGFWGLLGWFLSTELKASYYRIFIYIYTPPFFWWLAHWFVSAITCFSAFRIFSAGWRMSQVRDHHSAAWILQWCVQSLVLSCIISSGHIRMGGQKYLLIIYL
jgi:hypothetical protein